MKKQPAKYGIKPRPAQAGIPTIPLAHLAPTQPTGINVVNNRMKPSEDITQPAGAPYDPYDYRPLMPSTASNDDLTQRQIPPTVGEWVQLLPKLPPEQVRAWLLSAAQGNFYSAYSLFSVMEDTWPRLRKDLHEVREAVSKCKYQVHPFTIEGEEPTDDAKERAKAYSFALQSFNPIPGSDEKTFEGTVYDLTAGLVTGVTAQEVLWELNDEKFWQPRATCFIFTPRLGFTQGHKLGIQGVLSENDYWAQATAADLNPDRFLIGQYQTRSGPATTYGLLRPLAWWWCAGMYGRDWLLKYAQIFGQPMRWANYPKNSSPDTISKLEMLLKNMGSSSYAALPEGVKMELIKDATGAADNPQTILMDMADKYADLMILGQTLTSDVQDSGSRALGDVHANTLEQRIVGVADWVASNPLDQLARAFCRVNYGDVKECPVVKVDNTKPQDPVALAQRDQILLQTGIKIPKQWFYDRHNIPVPEDGEPIIGGMPEPAALPPAPTGEPGDEPTDEINPDGETPAEDEEAAGGQPSEAREMLIAAMGNGDKHNRVYEFTKNGKLVSFRSTPLSHTSHRTALKPVQALGGEPQRIAPQISAESNNHLGINQYTKDGKTVSHDELRSAIGMTENRHAEDGTARRSIEGAPKVVKELTAHGFTNAPHLAEPQAGHTTFATLHHPATNTTAHVTTLNGIEPKSVFGFVRFSKAGIQAKDAATPDTKLNRNTLQTYTAKLAQANAPLLERLRALQAISDDKMYAAQLAVLAKDFPTLAKQCLKSPAIRAAANALQHGTVAAMFNGMVEGKKLQVKSATKEKPVAKLAATT